MKRMIAMVYALVAFGLLVANVSAADKPGKAVKAQMVAGTIKLVDASKNLLIVNQKLKGKGEVVQRELSITENVEFVIKNGDEVKEGSGVEALRYLEGLEGKDGAGVKVQCDKDVNVIKVTVMLKKKK